MELMEQVKYDWKMNQGEPLKILKKYAALGKRYSVVLIGKKLIRNDKTQNNV